MSTYGEYGNRQAEFFLLTAVLQAGLVDYCHDVALMMNAARDMVIPLETVDAPFRRYRATYRYAGEGKGAPVVVSHLMGDSAWVTVLPCTGKGHRTGDAFYVPITALTRENITVDVDDAITALTWTSDQGAAVLAELLTIGELRTIADQVGVDTHGARKSLTARTLAEVRA